MVLVEPRRKRASFLRAVRRLLPGVALTVLEKRADALSNLGDGSFDAIVSRAAISDEELLSVASGLLREGGLLIAYRGTAPDTETPSPSATATFGPPRLHRYRLPGRARQPFTLVIREKRGFT
jgi:16S rRNA G527 N7-methylase RsmG